jgi:hypothetical protein
MLTLVVGTLYEIKYSLYWWNRHFVKSFTVIFAQWNVELLKFIHLVAVTYQLPRVSWAKNVLTDSELSLLYRAVVDKPNLPCFDNSLQHYNAWLVAWGTGVRPGSMTLTLGYRRGDRKPNGDLLEEDETFRWKDVEFFKYVGLSTIIYTRSWRCTLTSSLEQPNLFPTDFQILEGITRCIQNQFCRDIQDVPLSAKQVEAVGTGPDINAPCPSPSSQSLPWRH